MLENQVQVDADGVEEANVGFFQDVHQPSLIDVLLQWVQVQVESLVLRDDWRPQVEDLVHRILLEASQ